METLLRPKRRDKRKFFFLFVVASLVLHGLLVWLALPQRLGREKDADGGLHARFLAAVSGVTELEPEQRAKIEEALQRTKPGSWKREVAGETLLDLAGELGVKVEGCEVVRALDPERARERRWDVRIRLVWGEGSDASTFLVLASLAGEATLKSAFGSHRLWLNLEGPDGSGRVALETMDCRLYLARKLSAADLLHRATWVGP